RSQVGRGREPLSADALAVDIRRVPILCVRVQRVPVVENLVAISPVEHGQLAGERRAAGGGTRGGEERWPIGRACAGTGDLGCRVGREVIQREPFFVLQDRLRRVAHLYRGSVDQGRTGWRWGACAGCAAATGRQPEGGDRRNDAHLNSHRRHGCLLGLKDYAADGYRGRLRSALAWRQNILYDVPHDVRASSVRGLLLLRLPWAGTGPARDGLAPPLPPPPVHRPPSNTDN